MTTLFTTDAHDELAALRARVPDSIRFGTSSWTYPGWRGIVYERAYPARGAAPKMLAEYARWPLFGTVGIDSSFYAPPAPETLESYARALPPGFPCVSKVWNRLTIHTFNAMQDRARAGTRNPDFLNAELFLSEIYEPYQRHFADHAGPFVFEFQAVLPGREPTAEAFPALLDAFFERLPREGSYAVEIRNADYLTPAYFAVLREHGVAHLFNSWTRMPPIGEQLDLDGAITGGFLVARALLRPGRTYDDSVDAFAPFDRIREPDPELRRDLVRLMQRAVALALPAYVIVNNRTEGCSPLTIAEVMRLWASGSVPVLEQPRLE